MLSLIISVSVVLSGDGGGERSMINKLPAIVPCYLVRYVSFGDVWCVCVSVIGV